LKQSNVSSHMTGPFVAAAAMTHFSVAMSFGSPWSSGRSSAVFVIANGSAPLSPALRIAVTSSSFFALPVTKVIDRLWPSADIAEALRTCPLLLHRE